MKIIKTSSYLKKAKIPESETTPYNPWAVCNKSTGGKKKNPDKFEKCVHDIKKKNKKENKIKDVKASKYPEEETTPYNPWAVCNKSTGGKKENPDKFEKCVQDVKAQNREENDDTKDVRGRTRDYRSNYSPEEEFDIKLKDEMSGKREKEEEDRLNAIFNDVFRRVKEKERLEKKNIDNLETVSL